MGCCGNPIGDTPGVIPQRRMSESHPCPRMLHTTQPRMEEPPMGHNRPRSRQTKGKKLKHPSLLKRINRNAAGIDCGSETHFVEERGFEVVLVNSRHVKNVPGRNGVRSWSTLSWRELTGKSRLDEPEGRSSLRRAWERSGVEQQMAATDRGGTGPALLPKGLRAQLLQPHFVSE